jgi:type VI secretion system secreted protein VgrG
MDASFHLKVNGQELRVRRVDGAERVHAPYRIEVTTEAQDHASVDVEALLGEPAELDLAYEGSARTIHGIVDEIVETGRGHRFVLAPRLAPLGDSVDHRVFLDQDAVAIAEGVLQGHGLDVEKRVSRTPPKRPQCVQAFESDLAFVGRLLAEEGVLYYLEHQGGKDVVIFADHAGAHSPIPGGEALPFSEGEAAGLTGAECVFGAALARVAVTGKVALRDQDFEHPLVDQTASAGAGPLERYEYPGGYTDPGVGATVAGVRLEEAKARQLVLRGSTNARRLVPGATFKLTGAPRDEMNARWLVLEVEHRGTDYDTGPSERRYQADFVAVPADAPHRPPRVAAPTLGGVQTATVTGPGGAEIHTEKHGRIKALLRWDRLRKKDDHSSHWLRPIQPPTSGGFFLPRTGWEVLVGFQGASGDTPYEIGRLYNGQAPPPEGLPAQKVRSAFGTLTTPGGGSANLLRMDDAAGNEGMLLNASKDYNERTENDKGTSVKANDAHDVGADHTHTVGILHGVTVDGAQSYSVGGSRDVTTVGALGISAASESVAVGGLRFFKVGGDYETHAGTLTRAVGALKSEVAIQEVNRHVTGVSTVMVGGGWTEVGGLSSATSVLGASVLKVGGPISVKAKEYSLKASALKESYSSRSVKAGAKRSEEFGAAVKYTIDGALSMKGSAVFFAAKSKITIKASGVTVTITPSSIKIKGDFDSSEASVVTGEEANG